MKKDDHRALRATGRKNAATPAAPLHRRDATGHLDPAYAEGLRALERDSRPSDPPNPDAFLRGMHSGDPLAELLGENFVSTANSGEDDAQDDAAVTEEVGGPFIESTSEIEFAFAPDSSNPPDATREPFPATAAEARSDLGDDEIADSEDSPDRLGGIP